MTAKNNYLFTILLYLNIWQIIHVLKSMGQLQHLLFSFQTKTFVQKKLSIAFTGIWSVIVGGQERCVDH